MTRQPQSPFNLGYRTGADLKPVPEDAASMQAYVDFLLKQLRQIPTPIPAGQARAIVKLLGEIGAYAVILKQALQAEKALEQSLNLIEEHKLGLRTWAVHTLRYGDALLAQKNELGAETAYRSVLEFSTRNPDAAELENFAWQHLGKLRFDQGNAKEATEFFGKALALRKKLGVKELIEATELALRVLKMKKPLR